MKTYMKSPEKQQNPGDSGTLQSKEDDTLRMKSACHILHSVENSDKLKMERCLSVRFGFRE